MYELSSAAPKRTVARQDKPLSYCPGSNAMRLQIGFEIAYGKKKFLDLTHAYIRFTASTSLIIPIFSVGIGSKNDTNDGSQVIEGSGRSCFSDC